MVDFVLEALKPNLKANGGMVEAKRVCYVEGRSNLVLKIQGKTDRPVSFVG
ncbi:hypothetical protein SARC_15945, partial [Sphaeroforma arctica JP610]